MVSYPRICIFLGVCMVQLCAFSPTSKPSTSRLSPSSLVSPLRVASSDDELASTFPRELPAGMRGEAVRSAIRSPNGVCMDYTSSDQFGVGVVKVDGSGVQNFLEGKLSNSFDLAADAASTTKSDASRGKLVDSCLLTARGRTVDRISVSLFPSSNNNENDASSAAAYLLTSPGHAGSALFRRLDPYVFPMDGVKLTDVMDASKISTRIITVAATKLSHVKRTVERCLVPNVKAAKLDLPRRGECTRIISADGGTDVIILPSTFLPDCVCVGYTFVISESSSGSTGGATARRVWGALTSEFDDQAPVKLGPLEWETLRIEGGWPAYGREMTGDVDPNNVKDCTADGGGGEGSMIGVGAKASPLELHLESAVDETKGCYLGQEAISALLKNKRGVPRSLYSVVFNDDDIANGDSTVGGLDDGMMDLASLLSTSGEEGDAASPDEAEAEMKQPLPGNDLYVLGSAGKIKAGMITSVAEPNGSGDPTTLCLALIRRSDSILSKMETMGLELGGGIISEARGPGSTSLPPHLDPLDGLEVIIPGTNTIGKLQSLPCRRFRNGLNMFDAEVEAFEEAERDSGAVMGIVDDSPRADASEFVPEGWDAVADDESINVEGEELRQAEEEAAKAAAEAEAAAAEAKRKAEKMEMLKKKAEEAMARRRKKKK